MFAYGYFNLQLYETAPCRTEFRGIIKFIRIYYNTNSRGLGNFSWISLLDLLAFSTLKDVLVI